MCKVGSSCLEARIKRSLDRMGRSGVDLITWLFDYVHCVPAVP